MVLLTIFICAWRLRVGGRLALLLPVAVLVLLFDVHHALCCTAHMFMNVRPLSGRFHVRSKHIALHSRVPHVFMSLFFFLFSLLRVLKSPPLRVPRALRSIVLSPAPSLALDGVLGLLYSSLGRVSLAFVYLRALMYILCHLLLLLAHWVRILLRAHPARVVTFRRLFHSSRLVTLCALWSRYSLALASRTVGL